MKKSRLSQAVAPRFAIFVGAAIVLGVGIPALSFAETPPQNRETTVCVDWDTKELRFSKYWEKCPPRHASMVLGGAKSAYDLAVEFGFVGSVEEWLDSLKGAPGIAGQGSRGPSGPVGPTGAQGPKGDSGTTNRITAEQIAEKDWAADLGAPRYLEFVENPLQLAFDGVHVWVWDEFFVDQTNVGTLYKFDPETGEQLLSVDLDYWVYELVYGDGFMWALSNDDSLLLKLDISTGNIVDSMATTDNSSALAFGANHLWMVNEDDDTVWKLDPSDLSQPVAEITVGRFPDSVTVSRDGVWVTTRGNQGLNNAALYKISADTTGSSAPSSFMSLGANPCSILQTDGFLLFCANYGSNFIQLINPFWQELTRTAVTAPSSMIYDGHHLWVLDANAQLLKVSKLSFEILDASTELESGPSDMAFDGTRIWLGVENWQTLFGFAD